MGRSNPIKRICVIPKVSGVGGMVSFRGRLVKGLTERGVQLSFDLADTPYEAVLVIGGTRQLAGLWRVKQRGLPIVQRLDGMNWIHRRTHTGWQHYLRAEYGNFILSLIRGHLASRIVYQSEFSRQWWEKVYGKALKPCHVVLNGVDLDRYNAEGPGVRPKEHVRILLVEGTIGGGYEFGVQTAIQLGKMLQATYSHHVEVMVVGKIKNRIGKAWKSEGGVTVNFIGQVAADKIPELDRSAHVLFAADLNPACPNSVIEALACGLPVAGFDTGALSEIVIHNAGILVPYGADPWKLEAPDSNSLARAVNTILQDQDTFRTAARQRAEEAFGVERMVNGYLEALNL